MSKIKTETKCVILDISPNRGYAPDQVTNDHTMTLGQLLQHVQEAIGTHGDDAKIVTLDGGNQYGAKYGTIPTPPWGELFRAAGDDEEDY